MNGLLMWNSHDPGTGTTCSAGVTVGRGATATPG